MVILILSSAWNYCCGVIITYIWGQMFISFRIYNYMSLIEGKLSSHLQESALLHHREPQSPKLPFTCMSIKQWFLHLFSSAAQRRWIPVERLWGSCFCCRKVCWAWKLLSEHLSGDMWGGKVGRALGVSTPLLACVRVFQNRGQYLETLHESCTYDFLLKFHFNFWGCWRTFSPLFPTDPQSKIINDFFDF